MKIIDAKICINIETSKWQLMEKRVSTEGTYKQTICNNRCCQGIVSSCSCRKSANLVIQANNKKTSRTI